jgi:hypothetical protein
MMRKSLALSLLAVLILTFALNTSTAGAAVAVKPGDWSNTSRLIEDTCGGAGVGATFPVNISVISFAQFKLDWFAQHFLMTRIVGDTFVGSYTTPGGVVYNLKLTFSSSTHYMGNLEVKFPWCNGHWLFLWVGQHS